MISMPIRFLYKTNQRHHKNISNLVSKRHNEATPGVPFRCGVLWAVDIIKIYLSRQNVCLLVFDLNAYIY